MRKRFFALLSACLLALIFLLSACAKQSPPDSEDYDPKSESEYTESKPEFIEPEPENVEVEPEPEIYEPAIPELTSSDYKTASYTVTDSYTGFKYEYTIRYTPWIFTEDETKLQSAWNFFGQGNALPAADYPTWGITPWYDGEYTARYEAGHHYGSLTVGAKSDIYYIIGDVSIKNVTGGDWHLTPDAPGTPGTSIYADTQYLCMMGRTFYSNTQDDYDRYIKVNAKMTRDSWGPVPFVYAFFNTVSPKFPDGAHTDYLQVPLQIDYADEKGYIHTIELPVVD